MSKTEESWAEIGAKFLGISTALFAVNAGLWYTAQRLPWWGYALMATSASFIPVTVKVVIDGRRRAKENREFRRIVEKL